MSAARWVINNAECLRGISYRFLIRSRSLPKFSVCQGPHSFRAQSRIPICFRIGPDKFPTTSARGDPFVDSQQTIEVVVAHPHGAAWWGGDSWPLPSIERGVSRRELHIVLVTFYTIGDILYNFEAPNPNF
jgi:hypothetical protein